MSTAGYGKAGANFGAHYKAGAAKRAAEEAERARRKGLAPAKTVVEKGFQGLASHTHAERAPSKDLTPKVADTAPVVNEKSTDEGYDHKAELEALPDADLAAMASELPNFDEAWTRKDFIRELLK